MSEHLPEPPASGRDDVNYLKATAGTVGGAAAGAMLFGFLLRYGIYAMVMPGVLVGLGCGSLAGGRATGLGVSAAVIAFAVSLGLEWHFFPFSKDDSLPYFVRHLSDLTARTWITVTIGTLAAFWFGRGR